MHPTLLALSLAGPATATDSHREALPEEANRDSGAGAAGPQSGHSGSAPPSLLLPAPHNVSEEALFLGASLSLTPPPRVASVGIDARVA